MTTDLAVSAIIPVHNDRRYIAEAIASVLAQTLPCVELIVVDDGSTDGSADIAAALGDSRLRILRQAQAGAGVARNRGAAAARGSAIAFLDADDRWAPQKIALQAAALARSPAPDMVFGHMQEFLSPDYVLASGARTPAPPRRFPGYAASTLLIGRDAFLESGGFDARWSVGEFVDWVDACRGRGLNAAMLPETLAFRRIHAGNSGRLRRPGAQQYAAVAKAALDRRRAR